MTIPGYIESRKRVSEPPVGDEFYDPVIGLPYFSADEIPSDWSRSHKISSHDWVKATYPPMFRTVIEGTTYLFFGEQATHDIQLMLRSDFKTKPYPLINEPILNKGWDRVYDVYVPSTYRQYFTDEEWFGLAAIDLVVTLHGVKAISPYNYARRGDVPLEIVRQLNAITGVPETVIMDYIVPQTGERIDMRPLIARLDKSYMSHIWDYPPIVEFFKWISFRAAEEVVDCYDVGQGWKYMASFVFNDGTESMVSDEVRVGQNMIFDTILNPFDKNDLETYFAMSIITGTAPGWTNVDLSIKYVPYGVTKVRYWKYVWQCEIMRGFPGAGWYLWGEVDAVDTPNWRDG